MVLLHGNYGTRSETQDSKSIRVTSADMDVYFCCSGERPRQGGERFAKGLNTPIRLDVCDIVFMLGSYSCIHAIIEQ